jgi:serine/threonine protein kinase
MSTEFAQSIAYCESPQTTGNSTMKFTFPPESKPLDGYTIKRAIQRGGFGEVYYALSDGGKEVALKLLQQNMEIELRGVSQCLNLKHPNLVTIFDIRTDADGDHWIVMEFVSGKGLDKVIDELKGGMPIKDVQHWLSGIAAGLSFLHDSGIVHRDLKPGNIFRENDVVKIGDVGLAKFISQSRRDAQTQSVGTVYYMAPEVAHGRYGHEVDVYSLGCVLYELLTGRVPFDGESTGEILMKHLSERPDLSVLPRRLRPVLARALEKDPLRRTPSAAQLEEEFRKAVLGVEIVSDISEASFLPEATGGTVPSGSDRNGSDLSENDRIEVFYPDSMLKVNWKKKHKAEKKYQKREHKAAKCAHRVLPEAAHAPRRHSYHKPGTWGKYWWGFLLCWVMIFMARSAVFVLAVYSGLAFLAVIAYCVVAHNLSLYIPPFLYPFHRAIFPVPGGTDRTPTENLREGVQPPAVDRQPGSPIFAEPVIAAPPVAKRRKRQYQPEPLTPLMCRAIPIRHRMTELTASMAFAVLCTAIITFGITLFAPYLSDAGLDLSDVGRGGLFGLTTLFAAWGVLSMSKCMEGTTVSTSNRRLMQLFVGAAVGAAAFQTDGMLMVAYHSADFSSNIRPPMWTSMGDYPLVAEFQPTRAGYMLFFAGLFALRRWWWHADAFRRYRFRLASVVLTVLAACLWSAICGFPFNWAVMFAAAISCVVHLSAVWVPQDDRPALMEVSHE